MPNGVTIHTDLIDGTLNGVRKIYMDFKVCNLYAIPREQISFTDNCENIKGHPAFYILLEKEKAYIGQTTDFASRKNDHVTKKLFKQALVFVAKDSSIYGDDVKYLEYLGIKNAKTGSLSNETTPKEPVIAPSRKNNLKIFFEDIKLLCGFYGCDLFADEDKSTKKVEKETYKELILQQKSDGIFAKGYYNEDTQKFCVKKGAILANKTKDSFRNKQNRKQFIKVHCKIENGQVILQDDVEFDSPSSASNMMLGRSSNGKTEWTDSNE